MTRVKVNPKDEAKVLEHIYWLIDRDMEPVPHILSPNEEFEFRIRLEVLAYKVKADYKPMQEDKNSFISLIRQTTVNLKNSGITRPNWEDFAQELDNAIQKFLAKPLTCFHVLIPFHISGSWVTHKRWFNVLGMQIQHTSWKKTRKFSGWEEFWKRAKIQLILMGYKGDKSWILGFMPLLIEVRARDYQDAYRRISNNFELLRALVNLVQEYNKVHFQGIPKPLAISLPSPVIGIFQENGDFGGLYYETGYYQYSEKSYKREQIEFVEKLLKQLNTFSNDMRDLLIDVLLKYGRAMDTIDWREGYLSLWQIVEALVLQREFDVKMDKIPSRIVHLIGIKDSMRNLYKDLISSLAESRHSLVHQGKFSQEGFDDFQMLKAVVELALTTLFNRAKKFPTRQSLEDFYINVAEGNDSVLHNRLKVIQMLLDHGQ